MDTADWISVISAAVAFLAFLATVIFGCSANRKSDRANEIAKGANEIAIQARDDVRRFNAPALIPVGMDVDENGTVVTVENRGESVARDVSLDWQNADANARFGFTPRPIRAIAGRGNARFFSPAKKEDFIGQRPILSTDVIVAWTPPVGEQESEPARLAPRFPASKPGDAS